MQSEREALVRLAYSHRAHTAALVRLAYSLRAHTTDCLWLRLVLQVSPTAT